MTISCRIFLRMRSISNKLCKENQTTDFIFSNFFPEIVPFMRSCRKIWRSQIGCWWQYSGALPAGLLSLHARKHTPAPVHSSAHTHTHPQIYIILITFPRQQLFCESASSRYMHVACLVFLYWWVVFKSNRVRVFQYCSAKYKNYCFIKNKHFLLLNLGLALFLSSFVAVCE